MTKYFPDPNKQYDFLQTNRSNILGNLWSTQGLDFQSNLGAIRLSDKLVYTTSTTDDADLGLPAAFEYCFGLWYAICGTRVFKGTGEALGAFTEDASGSAVTTYTAVTSDLAVFNDRLFASAAANWESKDSAGGAWTSRFALSAGNLHKQVYFKKTNRLYCTNTSTDIVSINQANTVQSTAGDYYIDLTDTFGATFGRISTMEASSDAIWIATMKTSKGTNGGIYKWDGVSSQISTEYVSTASNGILAMEIIDDVPFAVDTYGRILKYTGSSFKEVARLPVYDKMLVGATGSTPNAGAFVHYNGMAATQNNTLLIAVNSLNSDSSSSYNEALSSGVWELDLSTFSLTHKHSFSNKVHSAVAITDYAQSQIVGIGAIKMNTYISSDASGRPEFLCGATIYTSASASLSAIFFPNSLPVTSELQKSGYFVTTFYRSDQIEDLWQRLWAIYRRFLYSTDKIVLKYRLEEEDPTYFNMTWVDTTHFTTTTDITAYDPSLFDGLTVGGEVEVLRGTGSGACRHITSIVNNAGTYTVTLDYAVEGVTTGTAKARLQKWVKLLPEITGQVNSYTGLPIIKNSPRIQVKAYFEWKGNNEFYKMLLYNTTFLEIQG